ncbi:ATP-grasp domain-containing protein [Streptomyces palmae]|uniref:ATP-grasp domain-containing protein n=1 Tax=Streptomyces palmae TaxID=1701085 RepID=A0A4Z0HAZ8_9ACTN|nr:ATP-grasp domain-containing protein [Streptomyces palmae]TGB12646.1 ATP-grasp domain-containing protein [Streptomyces palmae]
MPTILVLGYRGDLDQALRIRGVEPFYIVQAPVHVPEHRKFICVSDMENAQEVLRAVLSADIGDVAGALTVHEMGVFTAAFLRRELGLPGNADTKATLYFRDKYLQKSRLPPQVARARCRHVPRGTSYADLAKELGEVFVLKPANGAGSLRTNIIRTAQEYEQALEHFPWQSDVEIVAEPFIDAPEVYIDGIWQDGDLRWWSMNRDRISPLSAVQGGVLAAHIMDSRRHPELFRQGEALARQALASLDAPDCVFHLEMFDEESGLTFGECAMRLPGALAPRVNKLTFGVDLFDAEISLALGEKIAGIPDGRAPDRFHGYLLLRRPRSGQLTQKDFEDNFVFDELQYSPDAPIGPYGRVGEAIVSDQDELKLQQTIEAIAHFNETGGE